MVLVSKESAYSKLFHRHIRKRLVVEAGLCLCVLSTGADGWCLFDEAASYIGKRATRRVLRLGVDEFRSLLLSGEEGLGGLEFGKVDGFCAADGRVMSGGVVCVLLDTRWEFSVSARLTDVGFVVCLANARVRAAMIKLLGVNLIKTNQ